MVYTKLHYSWFIIITPESHINLHIEILFKTI